MYINELSFKYYFIPRGNSIAKLLVNDTWPISAKA